MPFTAGVYAAPSNSFNPAVAGTAISETAWAAILADLSTALSSCVLKDGTQVISAPIPFAGFSLTQVGNYPGNVCEFRMSLSTATPVTVSPVTAATTVYVSPYKGNRIALYDGTYWNTRSSAEMSIAVPATTNTMYDLFCYDSSGTPTLEATAWTNDTTRATALTTQNGVYVKTGALTRRYLGSFRTTAVSGQCEDSLTKRYIWNYYHRLQRRMVVTEGTDTWTYTTADFRQVNGAAGNQVDFIVGVSEDLFFATATAAATNSGGAGVTFAVGIGIDSTNTSSASPAMTTLTASATVPQPTIGFYRGYVSAGKHFAAWLEYSGATGTTTWYGDNGQTVFANGIFAEVWG